MTRVRGVTTLTWERPGWGFNAGSPEAPITVSMVVPRVRAAEFWQTIARVNPLTMSDHTRGLVDRARKVFVFRVGHRTNEFKVWGDGRPVRHQILDEAIRTMGDYAWQRMCAEIKGR